MPKAEASADKRDDKDERKKTTARPAPARQPAPAGRAARPAALLAFTSGGAHQFLPGALIALGVPTGTFGALDLLGSLRRRGRAARRSTWAGC
jgi:hypothetical protein